MPPGILVAGETLVDFIPHQTGPLASVESFPRRAGGAPMNVEVDDAAKTGLAFASLAEAAEREFTVHRHESADTRLQLGRVDEATLDLVERAQRAGATVSFDPNARPELWADDAFSFPETVAALLSRVDVLRRNRPRCSPDGRVHTAAFVASSIARRTSGRRKGLVT